MKLAAKFNLIFIAVFGLGLLATGLIAQQFLADRARDQVLEQARLMMEAASSVRKYTGDHVRPVLGKVTSKDQFFAESVPAFSAIRMMNYVRAAYPEYAYREATLNPTNPDDRAVEWEADIIQTFRNDPSKKEIINERDTPTGRVLFLAKPMRSNDSCVPCHSTPEAAPAAMVAIYGRENGFRWKTGEVVAAQIMNIPMSIPRQLADKTLWRLLLWLGVVLLVSLVLLNLILVTAVVRPVSRLAAAADEISKGNLEVPEMEAHGKDEVSVLTESFNRMRRSLVQAIRMLEG